MATIFKDFSRLGSDLVGQGRIGCNLLTWSDPNLEISKPLVNATRSNPTRLDPTREVLKTPASGHDP